MNQSREDRLASELASRLAGCPDAETLATLQEGRLDAVHRRGIEEHVKSCTPCREAVVFLVRTGATGEFPEALPADVERRSEELLRDFGSLPARRQSLWPMMLQVAAGLTLVAALAVGGFSLLRPDRVPGDLGALRGDEPLTLVSPAGETGPKPVELRWVAHPNATRYRVVVLDEELQEVWSRTSPGPEPLLVLDQAEQDLLAPGHRYTWRVVALNEFGARVGESPAAQFEISAP